MRATTFTLAWGTSTGADRYEVCVDRRSNSVCDTEWVPATSGYVFTAPAAATFYWQVRAVNGAGTTLANGGTWWRFTRSR